MSPRQIADRASIERAWADYWTLFDNQQGLAEPELKSRLEQIATGAPVTWALKQAAGMKRDQEYVIGRIVHHVYAVSFDSDAGAALNDCWDASALVQVSKTTGKKSAGVKDDEWRGTFSRAADGHWLLTNVFSEYDQRCTP